MVRFAGAVDESPAPTTTGEGSSFAEALWEFGTIDRGGAPDLFTWKSSAYGSFFAEVRVLCAAIDSGIKK